MLIPMMGFFLKMSRFFMVSMALTGIQPSQILARAVYLNGTDVSSARDQHLKGVEVRIDAQGDIYMTAPQYEVYEEDVFEPLNEYRKKKEADHQAHHGGPVTSPSLKEANAGTLSRAPLSSRALSSQNTSPNSLPKAGEAVLGKQESLQQAEAQRMQAVNTPSAIESPTVPQGPGENQP